jgi:DNA polymerase-4
VAVEQARKPELKGKPVVVGGRPDSRGVVSTASYEARSYGLHSSMPLTTAARLCPHAIFIEGNYPLYREYSQKFMTILSDFCPYLEPGGLDEAYLDITGFQLIHGSSLQMASAIKTKIKNELQLCASIGIAGCKVIAKIASDFCKPDGLIEISNNDSVSFLSPLPVERLPGVGKKTLDVLHGIHIRTIGELSKVPVPIIKNQLGSYGEVLHKYANGLDERPVQSHADAKSISREVTFSKDNRDITFLETTLWSMCEHVGASLRKQNKHARCVTLKLRYADFTTITRSRTSKESFHTDSLIFQEGIILFRQALSISQQPVRLLGIGVSNLMEPNNQLLLFEHNIDKQEILNKSVDAIRNKYGFSSIQTGRSIKLKDIIDH